MNKLTECSESTPIFLNVIIQQFSLSVSGFSSPGFLMHTQSSYSEAKRKEALELEREMNGDEDTLLRAIENFEVSRESCMMSKQLSTCKRNNCASSDRFRTSKRSFFRLQKRLLQQQRRMIRIAENQQQQPQKQQQQQQQVQQQQQERRKNWRRKK